MSATSPPVSHDELKAALLDFQAAPGRYAIALNEPRILFEQALAVLSLAATRQDTRHGAASGETPDAYQAARFFVRHVLLRPGADHYTLLGLSKAAAPRTVREHYRLLIKLTHPDFATASEPWPANAASRVNLAYGVLSTPDKRSEYDQLLPQQPQKTVHRPDAVPPPSMPKAKAARMGAAPNHNRKPYIFSGLAAIAAMTMLVLFLASTPSKDESLREALAPAAPRTPSAPSQEAALSPNQPQATPSYAETTAQPQPTVVASQSDRAPVAEQPPPPPTQRALARQKQREVRTALAELPQPTDATDSVTLPLKLSLSVAMGSASNPKPPVQEEKASAPLLVAAPLSSPVVSREAEPVVQSTVKAAAAPLDMRRLQPLLAGLVESLQSGNGKQVQQWVEKASPPGGSAADFAEAYKRTIADARVTGLGRVNFSQRAKTTPQQIDGTVQLNLQSVDLQTSVKTFRLRAYFEDLPGGPRLFKLEAE